MHAYVTGGVELIFTNFPSDDASTYCFVRSLMFSVLFVCPKYTCMLIYCRFLMYCVSMFECGDTPRESLTHQHSFNHLSYCSHSNNSV